MQDLFFCPDTKEVICQTFLFGRSKLSYGIHGFPKFQKGFLIAVMGFNAWLNIKTVHDMLLYIAVVFRDFLITCYNQNDV